MKRCSLIIVISLFFVFNLFSVNASQRKPYDNFQEQLDNSKYQAIAEVMDISDVKLNKQKYIQYTLKIFEELSSKTNGTTIKMVFPTTHTLIQGPGKFKVVKANDPKMQIGKKYLVLSEYFNDYKEIVFTLSSYYYINEDDSLTLISNDNDYTIPANGYKVSDIRNNFKEKNKEYPPITHINIEEYFDFALSNCSSIKKGYMLSVSRNDSYTNKITAFYENLRRKSEKPFNYTYTSEIIQATTQNIKGGLFKEYIAMNLWINEKQYDFFLTKDSPNWNEALNFYHNFKANEFSKSINYPLIIRIIGIYLLFIITCFLTVSLFKKQKNKKSNY